MTTCPTPLTCGHGEQEPQPLLVGVTEAARLLGISRSTFYGLDAAGQIPVGVRLGRRRLWSVAELGDWVDAGCPARERWKEFQEVSR